MDREGRIWRSRTTTDSLSNPVWKDISSIRQCEKPNHSSSKSKHQDYARDELTELVSELAKLSYEAAILFPVELYVAFKRVSEAQTDILVEYDEGRDITAYRDALRTADAHWALMARQLIGVDELSTESLQLHSKKNALERLSSVEAAYAIRSNVEKDES